MGNEHKTLRAVQMVGPKQRCPGCGRLYYVRDRRAGLCVSCEFEAARERAKALKGRDE